MKQRINATITTPSSGYSIKILSVHEVDNQLIAVSKIKEPRGMVLEAIGSAEDVVIIKTSSKQALPVKHYLTDVPKDKQEHHLGTYGRGQSWGAEETTEFTPIENVSEIADLLNRGKCIYQPRTDGMIAARITRHEKSHAHPKVENVSATSAITANQSRAVLNIHMVKDDGTLKVVLEEIHQLGTKTEYTRLSEMTRTAGHVSKLDLEHEFHQTQDDTLRFNAIINNETVTCETSAIEFSLPANNPAAILKFMRFIDLLALDAKQEKQYSKPYSLVQIGRDSVLSSLDELFITSKQSDVENDAYFIVSPAPVVMQDFVNRNGTIHQPVSASTHLINAFIKMEGAPEYANTQTQMEDIVRAVGDTNLDDPSCLDKITGVPVSELSGDASAEHKKEIINFLEDCLKEPEFRNTSSFILSKLSEILVTEFYRPAIGKQALDGGKFVFNYTEYDMLKTAEFILRDDGRMSIKAVGAGYQKYYAPGARNHKIFKDEMTHLATVLGLEFAAGCDFHQEMIFTPESSLKLKAMGMHLNPANLHPDVAVEVEETTETEDKIAAVNPLESKAAEELIQQRPTLPEILSIMKNAKIFTGNNRDDSRLFANLIYTCDNLVHPKTVDRHGDPAKPKKDTIESLQKLYRLAAGIGDKPCLITPEIHHAIIGKIADYDQLEQVAELFNAVPDMNADQARKLFLSASDFLGINQWTSRFDESHDSFLRLLNAVKDHRDMPGFRDMMSMTMQFGHGWKWMTKELFSIIVDNIKTGKCYKIMSGFDSLSEAKAIDTFKDRFLQNLDMDLPLHELQMNNMLTKENIELAFHNPDYKAALQQCEMFSLTGWRSKNYSQKRDRELQQGLLENPELSHAIKVYGDLIQAKYGKDLRIPKNEYEQCTADFSSLIDCAGITKLEKMQNSGLLESIKQGITMFTPKKSVSVAERLAELQKKYQSQEAVVEVVKQKAAI